MSLQVDARRVGKVTVIKCTGRIVAGHDADHLGREVMSLIPEHRHFVLHLGDVHFLDSSGLGLLVRLVTASRAAHGDLKLCEASKEVARTLTVTNLSRVMEVHPTEVDAVSAFYEHGASKDGAYRSGKTVVCIDQSADVLAYVREVLRQAGYDPLTTANLYDARILIKAARPAVVILGPGVTLRTSDHGNALRQMIQGIPTIELGTAFATTEASEAAQQVLAQVRAHTVA